MAAVEPMMGAIFQSCALRNRGHERLRWGEPDGHLLDPVDEVGPQSARLPGELNVGHAVGQRGEQYAKLQGGQVAAEAECGPPPPNPTCGLGERPMSKVKGSVNTDSSRLAEL